AVGKLRRHMLAEQARYMSAFGGKRGIERRGDENLDNGFADPAEFAGTVIGAIHVGEGGRNDDARRMMVGDLAAGQAGEGWQLGKPHIHAENAGAALPSLHASEKIRRKSGFRDELAEKQLGIEIRNDGLGPHCASVGENDTAGALVLHNDLAYAGIGFDLDTLVAAGLGHGLRDGAHSAPRMTPDTLFSVYLAETMMPLDIGRARRLRTGDRADDRIKAKNGLHAVALEPAAEKI